MNILLPALRRPSSAPPPPSPLAKELEGIEVDLRYIDPDHPLAEQVQDIDVIIVGLTSVTSEVMDGAPNLKLIIQFGVGLDTVDIPAATARNIYVANVPGPSAVPLAEHAMLLILALARQFPQALEATRTGPFAGVRGTLLAGKTLGIVGLGRSGRQLAARAKAFGMRVLACEKIEGVADPNVDFVGGADRLDYVLENSDFASLHVDLNDETKGLISAERLQRMKKTAFLVNVARAGIIVKQDLLDALKAGTIAGAALDVFWKEPPDPDDELISLGNVIATPHVATATNESRYQTMVEGVGIIKQVALGQKPDNCVNL